MITASVVKELTKLMTPVLIAGNIEMCNNSRLGSLHIQIQLQNIELIIFFRYCSYMYMSLTEAYGVIHLGRTQNFQKN